MSLYVYESLRHQRHLSVVREVIARMPTGSAVHTSEFLTNCDTTWGSRGFRTEFDVKLMLEILTDPQQRWVQERAEFKTGRITKKSPVIHEKVRQAVLAGDQVLAMRELDAAMLRQAVIDGNIEGAMEVLRKIQAEKLERQRLKNEKMKKILIDEMIVNIRDKNFDRAHELVLELDDRNNEENKDA